LRATINALTSVAIDPLLVRDSNSESVEKRSRIDSTDTNNMDTVKTCSVNSNNVSATRNSSSPPSKKQKYSIESNKESSSPSPQHSDKDTCSSNIGGVLTNHKAIPDTRVWQTILLPTCENLTAFEECWLTAAQEDAERVVRIVTTCCEPRDAAWILHQWDSWDDSSGRVFDSFFERLGEENANKVHTVLITLQAAWRQQQGENCVQEIIGR
jgi:hypothetical protein